MHAIPCLAVAAILAPGFVSAAEPSTELDETLAARLITLRSDGRIGQIRVAVILEGAERSGPFETRHLRRVVAIHPVIENSKMVRRMRTYDFHWTPVYGWCLWEMREERGGDAIWIWSETQGEQVLR